MTASSGPESGQPSSPRPDLPIVFIGGGNMAGALIGGLLRQGFAASAITVIEPFDAVRERLSSERRVATAAAADAPAAQAALQRAALVVWAVKPQVMREAVRPVAAKLQASALHLSVAAGIRSDSIAGWLGTERIVRAMPNTPALMGRGITGLFARGGVSAEDRERIEQVLAPTGQTLWLAAEAQLDAVTALSGSGPAYVFYFIEAMTDAGVAMGLPAEQAQRLAVATFGRRGGAGRAIGGPARRAASASHVQGRNDLCGADGNGGRAGEGAVHAGDGGGAGAGGGAGG